MQPEISAKRILMLLPASTYRAGAFMQAAEKLDLNVIVGSDHKQVLSSVIKDRTLYLPLWNTEKSVQEIEKFNQDYPLDAVIGVDEQSVVIVSLASEKLGLPGNSSLAVKATRDKYLMREMLLKGGAITPEFRLIDVDDDPEKVAQNLEYPSVLKPLFLSMSKGVIKVDDPDDCIQAFRKIKSILSSKESKKLGGESANFILAEEFIDGIEVALEGIVTNGDLKTLAIFDKPDPLEGPYFVETIYLTPSRFSRHLQERIIETTQQSIHALGITTGPVHAELRVNDGGVWMIEIAARSIGGLCSKVLRFENGLSLEELILLHYLNVDVSEIEREEQAAGVMMIPVPKKGVLKSVAGRETAQLIPEVEELIISIPPGEEVEPLPAGGRYLGFLFARGESATVVERAIRQAYDALDISIK